MDKWTCNWNTFYLVTLTANTVTIGACKFTPSTWNILLVIHVVILNIFGTHCNVIIGHPEWSAHFSHYLCARSPILSISHGRGTVTVTVTLTFDGGRGTDGRQRTLSHPRNMISVSLSNSPNGYLNEHHFRFLGAMLCARWRFPKSLINQRLSRDEGAEWWRRIHSTDQL